MFSRPYRIPALIAVAAAVGSIAASALGGLPLARQCAAVCFLAAAVALAQGPRSALRWALCAALALRGVLQLLTLIGYARSTAPGDGLARQLTDLLIVLPAGVALVVALLFVPRTARRTRLAAVVSGVLLVMVLIQALSGLAEPAWAGPLLLGTWPGLLAVLVALAVLFLTVQRATSLWPVAGAGLLTWLTMSVWLGVAELWTGIRLTEESDSFVISGVRYSAGPELSVLPAFWAALALTAPILLAWGLLRRPAPPRPPGAPAA